MSVEKISNREVICSASEKKSEEKKAFLSLFKKNRKFDKARRKEG